MIVNTDIAETINITTNGEYNVARYTTANVNTPAAPAHYIEKTVDANGKMISTSNIMSFAGVTDIGAGEIMYAYEGNTNISGALDMSDLTSLTGNDACSVAFSGCTGLTSVDLSSLATVSGIGCCASMFSGCTGLTSIDLSSLATVSGREGLSNTFHGCTGLTSVNLSALTTISGQNGCGFLFSGCTNLASANMSGLTTISGEKACRNMFQYCSGLTSVDLSALTTLTGSQACNIMFYGCTSLTSLSFPALTSNSFGSYYTNQFNNMLQACSGVTVHFPSNLQSVIGSWSDVTNGFGGTNTTVLYDLPATE